VQVQRVTPGRRAPARLVGSILARDLTVSGERWSKGRRLTADDLAALSVAVPGGKNCSVIAFRAAARSVAGGTGRFGPAKTAAGSTSPTAGSSSFQSRAKPA